MILPFGITGFRSLRSYERSFLSELQDQHRCGTQKILPIGIMGSTHLWNLDNPSYWNYGINSMIFLLELWDLGLYGVTNDPSFQNYEINIDVELRQSFL